MGNFHTKLKAKIEKELYEVQHTNHTEITELASQSKKTYQEIQRFYALRSIVLITLLKRFMPGFHTNSKGESLNVYLDTFHEYRTQIRKNFALDPHVVNRVKAIFKGVRTDPQWLSSNAKHIGIILGVTFVADGILHAKETLYPFWSKFKGISTPFGELSASLPESRVLKEAEKLKTFRPAGEFTYHYNLSRLYQLYSTKNINRILKESRK